MTAILKNKSLKLPKIPHSFTFIHPPGETPLPQKLEQIYQDALGFLYFMGFDPLLSPDKLLELKTQMSRKHSKKTKKTTLDEPDYFEEKLILFRRALQESYPFARIKFQPNPNKNWFGYDLIQAKTQRLNELDNFIHRLNVREAACLYLHLVCRLSLRDIGLVLNDSGPSLRVTYRLSLRKVLESLFPEQSKPHTRNLKILRSQLKRLSQQILQNTWHQAAAESLEKKGDSNKSPIISPDAHRRRRFWMEAGLSALLFFSGIHWHEEISSGVESFWNQLSELWNFSQKNQALNRKLPRLNSPLLQTEGEQEDFAEGDLSESDGSVLSTGKSEVWRFQIKTDSPEDIRLQILDLFKELSIQPHGAKGEGIEAPGGIQIDLLVSQTLIPDLKRKLEHLALEPGSGDIDLPFQEAFTWYKSKSKAALPDGQVRVVIWLSQI